MPDLFIRYVRRTAPASHGAATGSDGAASDFDHGSAAGFASGRRGNYFANNNKCKLFRKAKLNLDKVFKLQFRRFEGPGKHNAGGTSGI